MPRDKLDRAIGKALNPPRPDQPDEAQAWRLLTLQDENDHMPPDGWIQAKAHIEVMTGKLNRSPDKMPARLPPALRPAPGPGLGRATLAGECGRW